MAKLRLAQAAMGKSETNVADLCAKFGITRQTLYHFVGPKGELRSSGKRLADVREEVLRSPPLGEGSNDRSDQSSRA